MLSTARVSPLACPAVLVCGGLFACIQPFRRQVADGGGTESTNRNDHQQGIASLSPRRLSPRLQVRATADMGSLATSQGVTKTSFDDLLAMLTEHHYPPNHPGGPNTFRGFLQSRTVPSTLPQLISAGCTVAAGRSRRCSSARPTSHPLCGRSTGSCSFPVATSRRQRGYELVLAATNPCRTHP